LINLLKKISLVIGALLFYLLPQKIIVHSLQHWSLPKKDFSWLQKFLFDKLHTFVLLKYYSKNTTSKEREDLKYMCMGQSSGMNWVKDYARTAFPNSDTDKVDFFKLLNNKLSGNTIMHAHQVACGSGREIAYYAKKYPKIKFIGSDIDKEVISFCSEKWKDIPNLTFEIIRLDRLNENEIKLLHCDLIFASGGLQYLDELHLTQFLKIINGPCKYIMFTQPLSIDFLMDRHNNSSRRGNFSWNHPYTKILTKADWQNISYSVNFIEEDFLSKIVNFSAENQ